MRAKSPPKQWERRSSEKIAQKKFLALIQEQPQVRAENKSKASKSRQVRAEQTGQSFPNHGWWQKERDRCHFGCLFGLTSKIQFPCVSQSNMGHKYQIVYILFGHFFKHKNVSYNHKNVLSQILSASMHNSVVFLVLSVRMFTMSCFMEHSCWSPSLGGWGWGKGAHCWRPQLLELDPVLQLQLLLLKGYAHLDRFLWTWQEVVFCKHILRHKLRNYCNAIANINSPWLRNFTEDFQIWKLNLIVTQIVMWDSYIC